MLQASNLLENTLQLVREYTEHDLPNFTDCVTKAFQEIDPVFTRKKYGEFFWHCASTVPGWLPQVVLANAEAESDGSRKLLSLWESVDYNHEVEDRVLFHATDEARHSRIFVKLTGLSFPDVVDDEFLRQIKKSLFKVNKKRIAKCRPIDESVLLDHLIQMNMGEIRTRLHMELIAPAMNAFTPEEDREQLQGILNGLAHDEIVHVGYIARLLEDWCESGDKELVKRLYVERLFDFNQFTKSETEPAAKAFSSGGFPQLLEI